MNVKHLLGGAVLAGFLQCAPASAQLAVAGGAEVESFPATIELARKQMAMLVTLRNEQIALVAQIMRHDAEATARAKACR